MNRLIVFSVGMLLVGGCSFRPIDYTFYNLSQVSVIAQPDSLLSCDGLKVMFFKNRDTLAVETRYDGPQNSIFIPSGTYDVALFNDASPNNLFRGASLEVLECYTEESIYSSYVQTKSNPQNVIVSPDMLYTGTTSGFEVFKPNTGIENIVRIELTAAVHTYRFFIPVKGLDYLISVSGLVSGMAGSYNLTEGAVYDPPCSILLDFEKGQMDGTQGLWCSFNTFGVADMEHLLYLFDIKLPDGTSQSYQCDITALFDTGEIVVPEGIVIDYAAGQSGFDEPVVGAWKDTNQTVNLN